MVCRPNAASSAVFHGKGIDLVSAKVSGIMEAIETFHAEQVNLPLRLAPAAAFAAQENVVDIKRLARSGDQPFDGHRPILWIAGADLMSNVDRWVPFEIVHANARLSRGSSSNCLSASTNGLASGNHVLEATSHALCEVIERDATSLWHQLSFEAASRLRLELSSIDDELNLDILGRFDRADIDVAIWDITSDVGVPAFQCLIADASPSGHCGQGAGCHPERRIALLRALTEAAQVRMTYIAGSREDINGSDYHQNRLVEENQRARLVMRRQSSMRSFGEIADFAFDTFEAEVSWIIKRLQSVGIDQAIIVDLSRGEHGISVVRAIVPGLEGSDHHDNYYPGARARAMRA